MGAFTPLDDVWYPDEDDTAEQNVNLATMASSIEEGIGARLRHQEIAVGLKASLVAGTQIPNLPATAPYQVTSANGDFAQGLTINAGVVTVATAGMYIVSASLSINPGADQRTTAVVLRKNNTELAGAEVVQSPRYYQTSTANCVVNCVAGDTLRVYYYSAGTSTGLPPTPIAANLALSSFSVSMIQALPL